jgi:hypothetical protein
MADNSISAPMQFTATPQFLALFPKDEEGFNWLNTGPWEPKDSPWERFKRAPVPGKPTELLPEHLDAFQLITGGGFDPDHSELKTFNDIVQHCQAAIQKENDRANPNLPRWLGRTEDRPTTWRFDMGINASAAFQEKIDTELRRISPENKIATPPVADLSVLSPVVFALAAVLDLIAAPNGNTLAESEEKEQWRWNRAVALLASLGKMAFSFCAYKLAQKTGLSFWTEYSNLEDAKLDELFCQAREQSGYPLSTLRLDFPWFANVLKAEEAKRHLGRVPAIFRALLILHLIKHVRLCYNAQGEPHLFAAYKGRWQRIPLTTECLHQSLAQQINQHVSAALNTVLELDLGSGINKNKRTRLQNAARAVLQDLTPAHFPEPNSLSQRPDYLVDRAVYIERIYPNSTYSWISPGIEIHGLARVDLKTGRVDKDAIVTGPDVLTYRWPDSKYDADAFSAFQVQLPDVVTPERPSVLIRKFIRNIADHGHSKGLNALIDAITIGGLVRHKLNETEIGAILKFERPLVPVLADDNSDINLTTNQGKTNMAKIMGGISTPEIMAIAGSACAPGPQQRELAYGIRKHGTCILDDWKLPQAGKNYFADQVCLQSLCHGHYVAVGIALDNGKGLCLDQALYTTGKYLKPVPDVVNRAAPIFMSQLTPESRCADTELVQITSGQATRLIRISALLYIEKNDLVKKLGELKPASSEHWRFLGHFALATYFADGDAEAVANYLKFAAQHCEDQMAAAHNAGVDEEIGDTENGFDPQWFIDNASKEVLDGLCVKTSHDDPVSPTSVLEDLVRNDPSHFTGRNTNQIMRNLASCTKRFTNVLRQHGLKYTTQLGYTIELVPKKGSGKRINGLPVAYIRVTHPNFDVSTLTPSQNVVSIIQPASEPAAPQTPAPESNQSKGEKLA